MNLQHMIYQLQRCSMTSNDSSTKRRIDVLIHELMHEEAQQTASAPAPAPMFNDDELYLIAAGLDAMDDEDYAGHLTVEEEVEHEALKGKVAAMLPQPTYYPCATCGTHMLIPAVHCRQCYVSKIKD